MERGKVYKWARGKSTFIINVFLTDSFEARKISSHFEAPQTFHLCVYECVCVLILSWDSFSCHLLGFSANNEIIMRSLMELKKTKKSPTSHELFPSPSPSFCLSPNLLCIIGLCFCIWDITEGGQELEMHPSLLFLRNRHDMLLGRKSCLSCPLPSPLSPDPCCPSSLPPQIGVGGKWSIWCFCRIEDDFISNVSHYPHRL